MEYVTCGSTEFAGRDLLENLRLLNTIDPDSGDSLLVAEFKVLRAIFRENRKSQDTRKRNFFFFCQNIPFSDLIQEKIVWGSRVSLYGRNNK